MYVSGLFRVWHIWNQHLVRESLFARFYSFEVTEIDTEGVNALFVGNETFSNSSGVRSHSLTLPTLFFQVSGLMSPGRRGLQ